MAAPPHKRRTHVDERSAQFGSQDISLFDQSRIFLPTELVRAQHAREVPNGRLEDTA